MTSDDQSGLRTPPFGDYPVGYQGPQYDSHGSAYAAPPPDYARTPPVGGYSGTDFPAPTGVPPLTSRPPGAVATRPRRRLAPLIAAASLSALVGAGAGVGSYAYLADGRTAGTPSITVTTAAASQAPTLDGTVAAAAAKIKPSVVTITVQASQGSQGGPSGAVGSGVVLDTAGHILTNDHVVAAGSGQGASGRSSITVTFADGTTAESTVVGTSASNDLAVIKVGRVDKLTPAAFAKSSSLVVGQAVLASGAPLGLQESVTSGIVSNTARPVRSGDNNDAVYLAVQTDAAINPGNSGGPLVDLNGSVVGINSSIASTGSSSATSQSGNIGIGFAIPADVAARVAGQLIQDGTSVNAALGVTVGGADSALSTATGVPLQSVASAGAAAKARLRNGDVVTRVDDFPTTTPDGLIAATRFFAPGTEVTVTYLRNGGSAQTVKVTLGQQ